MNKDKSTGDGANNAGGMSNRGTWKLFVFSAALIALTIILTRIFSINIGDTIRIGLGRLPVMLASIWYGPVVGIVVGAAADFLGAIMFTGYNPVLTLPAVMAGLLPYIFVKIMRLGKGGRGVKNSGRDFPVIMISVMLTKFLSQGVFMTLLLAKLYYGFEGFAFLFWTRTAITLGEGLIETFLIFVLYTNKDVYNAACSGFRSIY